MARSTIISILFGFAIGFFIILTLLFLLQNQMTVRQNEFLQCNRHEFVVQTASERSFATILVSC